MQGGTFDPGTPRRSRRLKSLTLALAGLAIALVLIVGGLTGLGRDMLPHDAWPTFDGHDDHGSVVLAPAEQRHHASVPENAGTPLGEAALPLPPAERDEPATPSDAGTGGTAAPAERTVRAEFDEAPVGEQRDRDAATKSFRASIDTDRDGLTDVKEERLGTDALSRDSDGDQLPDGWEARHGLNPTNISDADADADGDGLRNRTEFHVKSDPRVPDTDANGRPDGDDDTDGDGVSNGVEDDLPHADPTTADAPVATEPAAPETPQTPPTPATPAAPAPQPEVEAAPVTPEPAPAPAAPAPAPAVAETPAPASPALTSP